MRIFQYLFYGFAIAETRGPFPKSIPNEGRKRNFVRDLPAKRAQIFPVCTNVNNFRKG